MQQGRRYSRYKYGQCRQRYGWCKNIRFELRLTAYAGKPWTEVSYRIINTTDEPLAVKSLVFHYKAGKEAVSDTLVPMNFDAETDSTGCGDTLTDNSANEGPLFIQGAYWNWKLLKKDTAGNCADTGWKF